MVLGQDSPYFFRTALSLGLCPAFTASEAKLITQPFANPDVCVAPSGLAFNQYPISVPKLPLKGSHSDGIAPEPVGIGTFLHFYSY